MAKSDKQADKSDKADKAKPKAARTTRARAAKEAKPEASARPKAAKAARPAKAPKPAAKATAAADKPARKPAAGRAARKPKAEPQVELALEGELLEGFAPAPGAEDEAALADDDEDALHERLVAEAAELAEEPRVAATADDDGDEPPPALSPEEQELATLYGDELAAAPPAAAHAEYSDRQTADEDRAMLPEINGRVERQKRWEERREQRRQRRDQERSRRQGRHEGGERPAHADRERHGGGAAGGERPDRGERGDRGERAPVPVADRLPQVVAPRPEGQPLDDAGVIRVGNSLGDAAWSVFASIKGAQPMPVRQLAGMMRKRGLLDGDPEVLWPHLKAALLGDERSYKSLGLRPRIVYRGRDLFAPGPVAVSPTAEAEAELARALSVMAVATHRTLKDKIASASQAGFERLVHAYLVSAGFRDISWVKRVEGISYATALPPEGATQVLISARSGAAPVDRRGVGELRVGVEAKQLLAGYLFAARELSADAERELERNGRSITVVAGDAFVSALLASGVGVVTAAAPVRYVDDQLLTELLAG